MKRIICVVLASIMLIFAAGCNSKQKDNNSTDPTNQPIYTVAPNVPSKQTGANTSSIGLQQALGNLGYKAGAVIISFKGLVVKNISIEEMMTLEFYEFNEGGDDTPKFAGPLVKDVLELAGASNATSMSFYFGAGEPLVLNLSELDLETSIFALKKADKVFGLVSDEKAYLIYHMLDGTHGSPTVVRYAIELG